jgi:hypothetical protein
MQSKLLYGFVTNGLNSVRYKSANRFQLNLPLQISKVFPITKCISFDILTFAIIEKKLMRASTNYRD